MELFRRASEVGHVGANGQYGYMLLMQAYRTIYHESRRMNVLNWLHMTGYSSYSSFVHSRHTQVTDSVHSVVNLTDACKSALKVARYAHNRGDSMGTFVLGFARLLGIGVDINIMSAIDLLQSAASRNHADANYVMAEFLMGIRAHSHIHTKHPIEERNSLPEHVYEMSHKDVYENRIEAEKGEGIFNDNKFLDFTTASQFYAGQSYS